MIRPAKLLIVVVLLAAGVAAWWLFRQGGEHVAVDLIREFPTAKLKRPTAEVFSVVDSSLAGDRRQAIMTRQPSRVVWSVTVPDQAWLKVSLGLAEEAWTVQGDGVLFQIGVSDGAKYDELLSLLVNPYGNPSERQWQDLSLDLSAYAGRTVDVILNTYASPPGGNDANGDVALWGAPRIVLSR